VVSLQAGCGVGIIFFFPAKQGFDPERNGFKEKNDAKARTNDHLEQHAATSGVDI
jgi:hypothetical protein